MEPAAEELSLSEMRMLVSSVVHMDVRQIALSVITIPKLKAAIQDLMLHNAPYEPPTVGECEPGIYMLCYAIHYIVSCYYYMYTL